MINTRTTLIWVSIVSNENDLDGLVHQQPDAPLRGAAPGAHVHIDAGEKQADEPAQNHSQRGVGESCCGRDVRGSGQPLLRTRIGLLHRLGPVLAYGPGVVANQGEDNVGNRTEEGTDAA